MVTYIFVTVVIQIYPKRRCLTCVSKMHYNLLTPFSCLVTLCNTKYCSHNNAVICSPNWHVTCVQVLHPSIRNLQHSRGVLHLSQEGKCSVFWLANNLYTVFWLVKIVPILSSNWSIVSILSSHWSLVYY